MLCVSLRFDDFVFNAHGKCKRYTVTNLSQWNRRAEQVKLDNTWADEQADNGDNTFAEYAVSPGDVITLPVGGAATSMSLRHIPAESARPESGELADVTQVNLCRALSPCDPVNPTEIDVSQTDETNGVRFVALEVRRDCADVLGTARVDFEIEVVGDNRVATRRYSLLCEDGARSRKRRDTNTTLTQRRRCAYGNCFMFSFVED